MRHQASWLRPARPYSKSIFPKRCMAMRGGRGWHGNWGPVPLRHRRREAGAADGVAARARRMFEGGELRLVLLKLIADEPRHGYDLIRAIEELTGGEYAPSPGVVYPTLTLLQDMGLIEEAAGEGRAQAVPDHRRGHAPISRRVREEVEALFERLERSRAARGSRSAGPGDRPGGQES